MRRQDHVAAIGDESLGAAHLGVEHGGRQRPAKTGAAVEVEPIGTQLHGARWGRGVAMDDEQPMVARVGQERLADPERMLLLLLFSGTPGITPAWT